MAIQVKLDVFEGPLDLLLHLIDKNKLNIYDVHISIVTEQYIEYLNKMEQMDMGIASEFILMAATLLSIKSKMLIPTIEEEDIVDDPREELINQLILYKRYKKIGQELNKIIESSDEKVFKNSSFPEEFSAEEKEYNMNELLNGISLECLQNIFCKIVKQQHEKIDPIRSNFNSIVKEEFTTQDKINYLILKLKEKQQLLFSQLLFEQNSKNECIVLFLAMLELVKTNSIRIVQNDLFEDIIISVYKGSEIIGHKKT